MLCRFIQLLQAWQKEPDESSYTGTVLIDLLKAYYWLPHELITAKCEAYGFDNISLKLFQSSFLNRKQRVKIGSAISEQIDILIGIPQGFISVLLIFNIFINDLVMFIEKICNFADDNTLWKSSPSLSVVLNCLQHDITSLSIVLNCLGHDITSLPVVLNRLEDAIMSLLVVLNRLEHAIMSLLIVLNRLEHYMP